MADIPISDVTPVFTKLVDNLRTCGLVESVFQTARLYPDRAAIIDNGHELSYAQLETLVQALASYLGPDCGTVGVLTTRSANTVISLLAVLAAGGIYCPIDPTYPIERQKALLQAASCVAVIATKPGLTVADDIRVLTLPEHDAWFAQAGSTSHLVPDFDAGAYVLFTSGSTGAPKGVVTSHRAIAAAVHSLRELLNITASDKVLQFASLSWDTCFEEIFPALTAGAVLVIDDEAYSGLHARLLRMIDARQVTVLNLPSAFWHELVHYLTEDKRAMPACVRVVVIGGEAARSARLADWCALDTGRIRLVNTYGCTETTLVTHAVDLHGPLAGMRAERRDVPIGKHLPHVLEHIAESGELFIGGPSLALGYLHLPELNAQRFMLLDLGAGMQRYFRSGDRVSRTENGELVHHGRLDSELKVRGIRIDPAEVELEISSHPDVGVVVVIGVTIADHTSMAAYIVPRVPHSTAEVNALSADIFLYLRARLPSHLIPAQIYVVPELVYTSSGKVDRAGSQRRYATQSKMGAL